MTSSALTQLLAVLGAPKSAGRLSLADWDLLVRVARVASLEGRLHALIEEAGTLPEVPPAPRRHLHAARVLADRQHAMVRWEVARIHEALAPEAIPMMLLKGAAYVMAGLPCAPGRQFSDVDILVPQARIEQAEQHLFVQGWVCEGYDAYDQRYYRQWMHELPPLTHIQRKSVLDVHHTILPPTARLHPDPDLLWQAALPLDDHPGVYIPAPVDMVLHSATHLFHDGELENGLRDLADLDALLRYFVAEDPGFWERLTARAFEMDLARPLFYALRYGREFLQTPVPDSAFAALARARPSAPLRGLMDGLFRRGLIPHHWSCDGVGSGAARWLLYVRSHYLRMPLHLLLPHLVRKAVKDQRKGKRERPEP
ncbi:MULTISPECIES: nucleotidyltransferase family protein [unclassified Thioalkalivibrio]|uniref:nucleotidyltransferase domain-containing protein n=1 Tax=unclassified Thioalkalivibrio TaxID=2621013 RepID=UPI00037329ED|nr:MULTISPECIES: nucleotidyltransferase family protein [unclassified Thioalkalivibrio]